MFATAILANKAVCNVGPCTELGQHT